MLETFRAIRKRAEMYLGPKEGHWLSSITEALLECPLGASEVRVELQTDGSLTQIDNGVGISLAATLRTELPFLQLVLVGLAVALDDPPSIGSPEVASVQDDVCKIEIERGRATSALFFANAFSSWIEVVSCRGGKAHQIRYVAGELEQPIHEVPPPQESGNRISFKPDSEVFGDAEWRFFHLCFLLRDAANRRKVHVRLEDRRENESSFGATFEHG